MDIVYLVKTDPENDSEELRYSLRSLKNIPHNKVVIVGEKPEWATNVTFIPVAQIYSKNVNVGRNLRAAVESDFVSDDFILMNDDFFFMKEIAAMPNLNFGAMSDVIAQYNQRYPEETDYMRNMKALYKVLVDRGIQYPMSYELHTPMVFNKQKIKQLWNEVDGPLYQFRSFYGNYFAIGGTPVPDVKVFLHAEHNSPEYSADPQKYLSDQTFLSATGGSFKRGLTGEFVRSKFKEKSPYER